MQGIELPDDTSCDSHELLKPHIVTPLPLKQSCKAGNELRLLCLLTGYPPLKVNWYLNNQLLTENNRISYENNSRELIIKNVTIQDCGVITCHVTNKYGEAMSVCIISVENSKIKKERPKSLSKLPVKKRLMFMMNKSKSLEHRDMDFKDV